MVTLYNRSHLVTLVNAVVNMRFKSIYVLLLLYVKIYCMFMLVQSPLINVNKCNF